jgi:hypothetical protein
VKPSGEKTPQTLVTETSELTANPESPCRATVFVLTSCVYTEEAPPAGVRGIRSNLKEGGCGAPLTTFWCPRLFLSTMSQATPLIPQKNKATPHLPTPPHSELISAARPTPGLQEEPVRDRRRPGMRGRALMRDSQVCRRGMVWLRRKGLTWLAPAAVTPESL